MGGNNIRRDFIRKSRPIAHEIILAAFVTFTNLIVLFITYDGRHYLELPPLPVQSLTIVITAMMAVVLIWRHYIYNRMHNEREDRYGRKEHSNGTFMQLLFPYCYRLSCGLMFLGNCMLPMQFLFSKNLLDPESGDPYQFNTICALCYGFVFTMIGLNILADSTIFITQKLFGWTRLCQQLRVLMSNKRWCRFRAPLVFLLSAKIVLGGALIAKEDPIVVQITVPISHHLPHSLENFRIIQLSDVHIGVTIGRTRVKKIVDVVNDLCSGSGDKCDLIALTGDIVDGEPHGLMKAIEPLANLCHGDGVPKVFVPGNHEHIHFVADHVVAVLSEVGIDSLMNDNIRIPIDEARDNQLVVVGLDDLSSRRFRGKEKQAFHGIDAEKDTTILLAHQPNHLKVAESYGVDLMLSGHTHAGQFFPGTVLAWLFNSRFSGYYPSRGKTAVYVSAGTLFWGPPVRFSTRHHEITDIRLVRSQ